MEARELRIGNWVESDGNQFQIDAGWFANYHCNMSLSQNTNPIPLTEEWLVKLGFNYGGIWIELMGLMSCGRILQHKGMGAKSTAFYINEQFIANIQYLHELQNLYFALTGTELEITKL